MNKKKLLTELSKFKTDESKRLWLISQAEKLDEQYEIFRDKLADTTAKTINEIIEEDLKISENVKQWAAKGQKYDNFIQRFKAAIYVDEYADEEAVKLLKEAKETILNLRSNISKAKASTKQVNSDIDIMSKQLHIHESLTSIENDADRKRVKNLLLESDLSNMTNFDIDKKINLLLEG